MESIVRPPVQLRSNLYPVSLSQLPSSFTITGQIHRPVMPSQYLRHSWIPSSRSCGFGLSEESEGAQERGGYKNRRFCSFFLSIGLQFLVENYTHRLNSLSFEVQVLLLNPNITFPHTKRSTSIRKPISQITRRGFHKQSKINPREPWFLSSLVRAKVLQQLQQYCRCCQQKFNNERHSRSHIPCRSHFLEYS